MDKVLGKKVILQCLDISRCSIATFLRFVVHWGSKDRNNFKNGRHGGVLWNAQTMAWPLLL